MTCAARNPLLDMDERNEDRSRELRALVTAWMLFELRKREGIGGGGRLAMQYIPATESLIVKASDGEEWIVKPELLVELRSGLGAAARNALRQPAVPIPVEMEEER
jgi:hypothetical protein